MPMQMTREIRKMKNGMKPQTPLNEGEQLLFSEVCTVKGDGTHAESLVAVTSQRLLVEPWKKRATHGIVSIPYDQVQRFYRKMFVPVAGVLFNKYLVVESAKQTVFIMTQKRTADCFIGHLQYFAGQKCGE